MKYLFKAISLVSVGLILGGCMANKSEISTLSQQSGNLLANNELNKLFNDSNINGVNLISKNKFQINYNSNGTFNGTLENGQLKVNGQWYINNSEKCEFYSNGKMSCNKYYKLNNEYFAINRDNKKIAKIIVNR